LLNLAGILELAEPGALRNNKVNPKNGKVQKILLAEDTKFYLQLISEYLQDGGYEIITAENGAEALKLLQKEKVDIILSDIEMPIMDGFGLLEEVKKDSKLKNIPIVAITSLTDEKLIKKGKEGGFNEWCVKLDRDELINVIAKVTAKFN